MHAVWLLATAPKSRIADWSSMVRFSEPERRDVPDDALDKHTSRGRRMGRGTEHFFAEGTRLARFVPVDGEDVGASERGRRWRQAGRLG